MMADFAQLARQYQVQDYANPYMGSDMTEDGNVKLQSDSVTNQPEPAVAPAPVNPYEQQAQQLAMGVPQQGTPFTNPVPEQAAAPVAPEQAVAEQPQPEQLGPDEAALRRGQIGPAQPQDYNAYIASQESGPNPNVGYHYPADAQGKRKSTAYGTYGITAPAYRDIQMADPYFRGKDITSLTPEDQARANSAYRNVQTGQLKALGLEPTDENIRGAQLLGAGGLKRYLDTGTFSNQAARANGGAQNLENILKGRMAGSAAPASQPNLPPQPAPEAAAQPPAQPPVTTPGPAQNTNQPYKDASGMYYDAEGNPVSTDPKQAQYISTFQTQQNDPAAMAALAYDKSAPEAIRRAASDQVYNFMKAQKEEQRAAQVVEQAMTDPKEARKLTRELGKPSEEGSYVKAYLYQRLGLTDLAKAEQIKLGAGDHWAQSMIVKNGQVQSAWVKYSGNGAPLQGYTADGPMKEEDLYSTMNMKGIQTSGQLYEYKSKDGQMHQLSEIRTAQGQTMFRDVQTGEMLANAPIGMRKMTGQLPTTSPNVKQFTDAQGKRHIVEVTTLPGGGIEYKYDGQTTTEAPAGLEALGKEDKLMQPAITAKKSIMDKMRSSNNKAREQGAPAPYTEDQISEAGQQAYDAVYAGTKYQPGGATAPVNPASPPAAAPQTQAAPIAESPTTTPAAKAPAAPTTLNPALESQAQKIARYEIEMPKGQGAQNFRNRAIIDRVYQLNPNYDGQKYKENQAIVKDYSTGQANKSVQGLKTAFNHIDEAKPLIDNLNNSDYPAANKFLNKWATATGKSNVTSFEQVGPILAQEVMKTWNPSMGGVGEREEIAKAFNSARSPAQLNAAIDNLKGLMMGKLKPLADKYESTGRKDFWTNQINDDNVKETYDRWLQKENARHNKPATGTTKSGVKWKVAE